MKWRVVGADRDTGDARDWIIEAPTKEAAEREAVRRNAVIASVKPADEDSDHVAPPADPHAGDPARIAIRPPKRMSFLGLVFSICVGNLLTLFAGIGIAYAAQRWIRERFISPAQIAAAAAVQQWPPAGSLEVKKGTRKRVALGVQAHGMAWEPYFTDDPDGTLYSYAALVRNVAQPQLKCHVIAEVVDRTGKRICIDDFSTVRMVEIGSEPEIKGFIFVPKADVARVHDIRLHLLPETD